jgi:predicted transglutaminase-like cysteine proteinase
MNQKQKAAEIEINRLAIELLGLVNTGNRYTDSVVSKIRDISNQINYEINNLNDYDDFESPDEYESSLAKEEGYQKDHSIIDIDLDMLTATPDE